MPATPGLEVARRDPIRTERGRTQRRKCCVSFSSIRKHRIPISSSLPGFKQEFPESRAAPFALVADASSWMKCWHPDVLLKLYKLRSERAVEPDVHRLVNLTGRETGSPKILEACPNEKGRIPKPEWRVGSAKIEDGGCWVGFSVGDCSCGEGSGYSSIPGGCPA